MARYGVAGATVADAYGLSLVSHFGGRAVGGGRARTSDPHVC
jgi:hypothetical protein